jgi:BlaI family penicillinase repressor
MEISRRHPSFPRISSAELVIMKVVWEKAPVTANTVVAALQKQQHWKPKTIQTLLSRLVRKGVLTFEKKGREYHFRPRVEAAEYRHAASRSFLRQFFDGDVAPFLACLLDSEKLSRAELAELRRIVDGKLK